MHIQDILQLASMPVAAPSYPAGPYRFVDREYLIISWDTSTSTCCMTLRGESNARRRRSSKK